MTKTQQNNFQKSLESLDMIGLQSCRYIYEERAELALELIQGDTLVKSFDISSESYIKNHKIALLDSVKKLAYTIKRYNHLKELSDRTIAE